MNINQHLIYPDWPAPANVHAVSTTRLGGCSQDRFTSLNLGFHTQDDAKAVRANRERLYQTLELSEEPAWLTQIHGNRVVDVANMEPETRADAALARQSGKACVVMTADCLPILLCDHNGQCVAAVHAGWRGLASEIIPATITAMNIPGEQLMAWLGPAIGPEAFEVGDEVREQFISLDSKNQYYFKPSPNKRWLADIYALARHQLQTLSVMSIYGGGYCTVRDAERFYSYRRDGSSGRMASLIWLT